MTQSVCRDKEGKDGKKKKKKDENGAENGSNDGDDDDDNDEDDHNEDEVRIRRAMPCPTVAQNWDRFHGECQAQLHCHERCTDKVMLHSSIERAKGGLQRSW